MKFIAVFAAVALASIVTLSAVRGQDIDEGISAPTALTVIVEGADGSLGMTYQWGLDCPQSLCLVPDSVQIERNGILGTALPWGQDPNDIRTSAAAPYTLTIAKADWSPGDCFRFRLVAPAGDGKPGHFDYSDFSNKVCVPRT
jgi:hypothetical protein